MERGTSAADAGITLAAPTVTNHFVHRTANCKSSVSSSFFEGNEGTVATAASRWVMMGGEGLTCRHYEGNGDNREAKDSNSVQRKRDAQYHQSPAS